MAELSKERELVLHIAFLALTYRVIDTIQAAGLNYAEGKSFLRQLLRSIEAVDNGDRADKIAEIITQEMEFLKAELAAAKDAS